MKLPMFPERKNDARKGDQGKVLVIGGDYLYHGAPILAAMGAEKSGVDLVYMFVPPMVVTPARCAGLGFIVSEFKEEFLTIYDVKNILNRAHMCDAMVIGNGLGNREESMEAVDKILEKSPCPVVLDADALRGDFIESIPPGSVLTPHVHEFQRMFGVEVRTEVIGETAQRIGRTILCKGMVDVIADPDGEIFENYSGCAEMTVGGTGDVLAGVVAGFLARGMNPRDAARLAADWLGSAGEELAKERGSFTAHELVKFLRGK